MKLKIEKRITLELHGFYPEIGIDKVGKDKCGLYFVYKGIRKKDEDEDEKYNASKLELIYIGQAQEINSRIKQLHEQYEHLRHKVELGETLYYSICEVPKEDLDTAERACIFQLQPSCNKEHKDCYKGESVEVVLSGTIAKCIKGREFTLIGDN